MTMIDAVYTGGVFRPATPPDLPDGTTVRLTVTPALATAAPDPAAVLARIRAAGAKFNPATDNPTVTSANVDSILYGGREGAR